MFLPGGSYQGPTDGLAKATRGDVFDGGMKTGALVLSCLVAGIAAADWEIVGVPAAKPKAKSGVSGKRHHYRGCSLIVWDESDRGSNDLDALKLKVQSVAFLPVDLERPLKITEQLVRAGM